MTINTRTRDTPTNIIRNIIESKINSLFVAMPGKIVTINKAEGLASIQPIGKVRNDDEEIDYPIIHDVPIKQYRTKFAISYLPVNVDDTGLLVFCDNSLDDFLTDGSSTIPNDSRSHSLSDAVFLLGLSPQNVPITVPNYDSLYFKNKLGSIEIENSGKIQFKNDVTSINMSNTGKIEIKNATVELVSIIEEIIKTLQTAQTATLMGPQPLSNILPQLSILLKKITTMKA